MSTVDDRSRTFTFRPLARTVVMLGEQLISDQVVAVTELVKNCYDADSAVVTIDIDRNSSAIVIKDKGCGMTEEDILNKWLVPATTSKGTDEAGRKKRTAKGRVPIGGKGIGRFAVHHLGHRLELISKTEQDSEEVVLRINWDEYEKPDVFLDQVTNECFHRAPLALADSPGTVLRILGLKNSWDQAAVDKLCDGLGKLFNSSMGFSIELTVDGESIVLPQGRDRYLQQLQSIKPEWVLRGEVDESGNFLGTLNGETRSIYLLENRAVTERTSTTPCGPFSVHFCVVERSSVQSVKQDERQAAIAKLQNEINGVLIYRDACRVYPYGNPGLDWLGLDKRRMSELGKYISNVQLIAFVDITYDHNPGLVDKTNREGLLENRAYEIFRSMMLNLVKEIEQAREVLRQERKRRTVHPPLRKLFDELTPSIPAPAKRQFSELQKAVGEEIRHKEERVKVMTELSGIGLAAEKATHEINHLIGAVVDVQERLGDLLTQQQNILTVVFEELPASPRTAKLKQLTSNLRDALSELSQLTKALDKELKGLRPLYKAARATKKEVDVSDIARRALGWFQKAAANAEIQTSVVSSTPLRIEINEGLLLQVFMNLVDNSVYWLKRSDAPRLLFITVSPERNCVYVSDNGPGIRPGEEEIIFEPLVSRKEEGRGLGLYIVRELLEKQGHRIELTPENERRFVQGADFKITFSLDARVGG